MALMTEFKRNDGILMVMSIPLAVVRCCWSLKRSIMAQKTTTTRRRKGSLNKWMEL